MQGQQDGEQKSQNTLNADGGYSFKENVERQTRLLLIRRLEIF
jgi:hypothetical protein